MDFEKLLEDIFSYSDHNGLLDNELVDPLEENNNWKQIFERIYYECHVKKPTVFEQLLALRETEIPIDQNVNIKIKKTSVYRKWFYSLRDDNLKQMIARYIENIRIGKFGNFKPLNGFPNGFEIYIDYGQGFRVYCIRRENTVVVLLCGGNKKTQTEDVAMAKKMVKNYNAMIKRKEKEAHLTQKRENINNENDIIITQDMVDTVLDAMEDEEMCKYLGISDWDD